MFKKAFSIFEILMFLLIISIALASSLPIISTRQKALIDSRNTFNNVPIGLILIWYGNGVPNSTFLPCNGQQIPDTSEYKELRDLVGEKTPNFSGLFLRGRNTQTISNGQVIGTGDIGTIQSDAIRNLTGIITAHANGVGGLYGDGVFYGAGGNGDRESTWGGGSGIRFGINLARQVPTAGENCPVSIGVNYVIKAKY